MSGKSVIQGSDFFKSLGKLEALAQTSQSEDMSKAQLFHTAANSEPDKWPGGEKKEIGAENEGWTDSMGKDGTDYKVRKAIADKICKGEALSPNELFVLKGDIDGLSKAKDDEDNEKEKLPFDKSGCGSVEKSFASTLASNPTIRTGFETSEFLAEFAKSFGAGLGYLEDRTSEVVEKSMDNFAQQLGDYLESRFAEQGEFNKSLADVVSQIGHGLSAMITAQNELAQLPVGAPKSISKSVQPVERTFSGVGPSGGESMAKSQVLDGMFDLLQKGQVTSLEINKYEMHNEIRPELLQRVTAHLQGR